MEELRGTDCYEDCYEPSLRAGVPGLFCRVARDSRIVNDLIERQAHAFVFFQLPHRCNYRAPPPRRATPSTR